MLNKNNERELAYVVRVNKVEPIEGYDRVEYAHINGWGCVVQKGAFKEGDLGVYFEIDSKCPAVEPFLFLEKRKYHVKTQKMCKRISQGLLMSFADFGWENDKYKESKYINSLIFNESEYFYLYNNPYSWNISKQMHDFTFNTCLFIGVSLTDPNMKRLLEASANPLKFNFIFMKKEEGFKESTYRSVTNYFFSYDLITIWIDKYEEIGLWLSLI